MRKKIDPDIRKITFTVSLAPALVRRLDEEAKLCNLSRSALIRSAINLYFRYAVALPEEHDDLIGRLEKQKLSSVYGEVHHAE